MVQHTTPKDDLIIMLQYKYQLLLYRNLHNFCWEIMLVYINMSNILYLHAMQCANIFITIAIDTQMCMNIGTETCAPFEIQPWMCYPDLRISINLHMKTYMHPHTHMYVHGCGHSHKHALAHGHTQASTITCLYVQ